MLALGRYESEIHACGFHSSLIADKSNVFQPEWHECPLCAGAEVYARMQHDADDKMLRAKYGDEVPAAAPRPGDGRSLMMRRLAPDEVRSSRA